MKTTKEFLDWDCRGTGRSLTQDTQISYLSLPSYFHIKICCIFSKSLILKISSLVRRDERKFISIHHRDSQMRLALLVTDSLPILMTQSLGNNT
jgi:hypothetical protein